MEIDVAYVFESAENGGRNPSGEQKRNTHVTDTWLVAVRLTVAAVVAAH